MTAIAQYPSHVLPAAPPFSVEVPEGFIAHAAPRALAMVRRADGSAATTENLTVSADLVQAGSSPQELLGSVLATHSARTVSAPEGDDQRATAVVARTVGGSPVQQRITVHLMPTTYAGELTTAVTVVATWPEQDPHAEEVLQRIHDSFSVTGV